MCWRQQGFDQRVLTTLRQVMDGCGGPENVHVTITGVCGGGNCVAEMCIWQKRGVLCLGMARCGLCGCVAALKPIIHTNFYNFLHLFYTGHSLGAAMAMLCAWDVQYTFGNCKHIECYTFGAPHVGNMAFKSDFEQRVPVCC